MTNPQFELKQIFDKTVIPALMQELHLFANLPKRNVGSLGMQEWHRKIGVIPKEPAMRREYERITAKVTIDGGKLIIPWIGENIELTVEQYDQITSEADVQTVIMDPIREALRKKIEKALWQGPSGTDEGDMADLFYGVADGGNGLFATTGNGTFLRPICQVVSTADDWEHKGAVQKDLGGLVGDLEAIGAPRPYALFYPAKAAAAFTFPINADASDPGDKAIKQYALELFDGGVFPVGDDDSGYCLMTGSAQTAQAFNIAAVSLPLFEIGYTEDLGLNTEAPTNKSNFWDIAAGARMVVAPKPIYSGGKYYKGMACIAGIDLSD
jgi:hypothetical protein